MDLSSAVVKLQLRQKIDREWRKELSPSEYSLVSYVYDRSLAWGRERALVRQEDIAETLGRSSRTIRRWLARLEARGMVCVEETGRGLSIWLNLEYPLAETRGKPSRRRVREGLAKARKPHVPREIGQKCPTRSDKNVLPDRTEMSGLYKNSNQGKIPSGTLAKSGEPVARGSLQETIDHTVRKSREAACRKMTKQLERNPVPALVTSWEQMIAQRLSLSPLGPTTPPSEEYRETDLRESSGTQMPTPSWSRLGTFPSPSARSRTRGKSYGQMRTLLRHVSPMLGGVEQFHTWLLWCCEHWDLLIQHQFRKMDQPPKDPSLGFLLVCRETFLRAWKDSEEHSKNGSSEVIPVSAHLQHSRSRQPSLTPSSDGCGPQTGRRRRRPSTVGSTLAERARERESTMRARMTPAPAATPENEDD